MFVVLHIADFSLNAVLRMEPGALQRPAALFSGQNKKSLVIALNPLAQKSGVLLGMTAPQAVARCRLLIIRTPHPPAEQEAQETLKVVAMTLSPSVEDTEKGVCTIDLRGTTVERTRPALLSAVEKLSGLGLPTTAGIAETPLLALYAARSAVAPLPEQDNDWTHAVVEVRDGAAFLEDLPLSVAAPSETIARLLNQWGLKTLGELTAISCEEIVRRLGAEGLALWKRAAGGQIRPLHLVTTAPTFSTQTEFEHEIETLEPLLFIIKRLLSRFSFELQAAQLVAAEIELTLVLENETKQVLTLRLPEATSEQVILFRALHTQLDALRTESCIAALSLTLTPQRAPVRQPGFFETGLRDPHAFAETLARIAGIVGGERIGTPVRLETHRPDAIQLQPPPAVIPPPLPPALHPIIGLPLRRFRPSKPVNVEFTQDRPSFVWADGIQGEVLHVEGPWQSDGDWWEQERSWKRTEWDVELLKGGIYRLMETGRGYFLDGMYD